MKPANRKVSPEIISGKAFQMNTTPKIAYTRIVMDRIRTSALCYFTRIRAEAERGLH